MDAAVAAAVPHVSDAASREVACGPQGDGSGRRRTSSDQTQAGLRAAGEERRAADTRGSCLAARGDQGGPALASLGERFGSKCAAEEMVWPRTGSVKPVSYTHL